MRCSMSGGAESVPGGMFVEAGYHGVTLPAKTLLGPYQEVLLLILRHADSICGYFR